MSAVPALTPDKITASLILSAIDAAKEVEADDRLVKHFVLEAILILCPNAYWKRVALRLAYRHPSKARNQLHIAKRQPWWRETVVDHIVGTLIAEAYGARAL